MKFGSKKAIFGAIWGGDFEGFGPCLGISHPTHPHLGKISQKKTFYFLAASLRLNYENFVFKFIKSHQNHLHDHNSGETRSFEASEQGGGSVCSSRVMESSAQQEVEN